MQLSTGTHTLQNNKQRSMDAVWCPLAAGSFLEREMEKPASSLRTQARRLLLELATAWSTNAACISPASTRRVWLVIFTNKKKVITKLIALLITKIGKWLGIAKESIANSNLLLQNPLHIICNHGQDWQEQCKKQEGWKEERAVQMERSRQGKNTTKHRKKMTNCHCNAGCASNVIDTYNLHHEWVVIETMFNLECFTNFETKPNYVS